MFRKSRKILIILLVFLMIFISVLILSKNNNKYLRGDIVIWTDNKYYSYFVNVSRKFREDNKKVNIKIVKINSSEYLNKILTENEYNLPSIALLDFSCINKVKNKIKFLDENKNLINIYKKNFSVDRLKEVEDNGEYYGIPFESNPIAMYVRKDVLELYGYESDDINTWDQLITIGNDIKSRSSEEVNLFSNEDKNNLVLLLLAQLIDKKESDNTNYDILNTFRTIYKEEYLTDENNYLFRLDSIDFYKNILDKKVEGIWECKNPPSLNIGENRLYDIGGKNLVVLNIDKNEDTIKEFLTYAATNKELLSEELLKNNFFPSSLYALKVRHEVEENNIHGTSPLSTLINIVERAPGIRDYNKLQEVLNDFYSD